MTPQTEMNMTDKASLILLVEDDPYHAKAVGRSLKNHPVANEICHLSDGEVAIDYLFRRGEYTEPLNSPRPHLIILDLRLPKKDGMTVLKAIKTTEDLRTIPVVILTTSRSEADMAEAYKHHANSYLVKPLDSERFTQMMNDMGFYWLKWNSHPISEEHVR